MRALLSYVLLLATMVPQLWAIPAFRGYIPNGDKVPHPCSKDGGDIWNAVGHTNMEGGTRSFNQFGEDFMNYGHTWSEQFCRLDSDGDGMSNGEELGDPNCQWVLGNGEMPERSDGLSHPGFCDPSEDNKFCEGNENQFNCGDDGKKEEEEEEKNKMECDYLKNDPNVMTKDLTFTETIVPNTVTNYYCQTFDLPGEEDYHLVGFEPIVVNKNFVHHMTLNGCNDDNKKRFTKPGVCGMSGDKDDKCFNMMAVWTVGIDMMCYGNNTGFPFGKSGHTEVKLEIHWNNPAYISGEKDSSGLRLYYQRARPNVQDLATMMIGQEAIEIPPGESRFEVDGQCSTTCTSYMFREPVYVAGAFNHMHLLGDAMKVTVHRNGNFHKVITNDQDYDYNEPKVYSFDPPIQLLPGDVLETTCVYNSLYEDKPVYFGEATNDEMCYAFLVVYPASAFSFYPYCAARGPLDPCSWYSGMQYGSCDWARFVNLTVPESGRRYIDLLTHCNPYGDDNDFCTTEKCWWVVDNIRNHPCMSGDIRDLVRFYFRLYPEGQDFLRRMDSCPWYNPWKMDDPYPDHGSTDGAVTRMASGSLMLVVMIVVVKQVADLIF